jgi:hypothetical protein
VLIGNYLAAGLDRYRTIDRDFGRIAADQKQAAVVEAVEDRQRAASDVQSRARLNGQSIDLVVVGVFEYRIARLNFDVIDCGHRHQVDIPPVRRVPCSGFSCNRIRGLSGIPDEVRG